VSAPPLRATRSPKPPRRGDRTAIDSGLTRTPSPPLLPPAPLRIGLHVPAQRRRTQLAVDLVLDDQVDDLARAGPDQAQAGASQQSVTR